MSDEIESSREAAIRRRQTVRVVGIVAVVALAGALAIDNRHEVELGWVVGETRASLVIALVATFLLGTVAGYLGGRRGRR